MENDPMGHWTVWVHGDQVQAVAESSAAQLRGYSAFCVDDITYIEVGYCRYSKAIDRAEVFGQVIEASAS